jgi:pilus assembly protein FimV
LNYGVVKRNDTLWEIAEELRDRSGTDVTVYQMMMALLRANPDAFIDNNVNKLKAGYVLRVDDPEVLTAMSRSDAKSEFWTQTRQWRAEKGRLVEQVEVADAGGTFEEAPSAAGGESRSAADQAKLKLVAPGSEGQGTGASADSEEVKQLREDILLATESLDASRQESEELATRVSELEEQLDSMQRLITLKDEELLAVQQGLGEEQPAAEQPAEDQAAEQPPASAAEETASSTSLTDYLLFAAVVLLLVGVVAWLIIRRKKMQEGFEESILNVGMASTAAGSAAAFGAAAASGGVQTDSGQSSSMVSDFAMSDMGGIQSDATEVDPISEADVYLAYGRHQQAEDIIKQALETNPDRMELHTKLLEVYHAAKNRASFEEHAQMLHDKLGGDESNEHWQRVVGLGVEIAPDNPLFGGSGMAMGGAEVASGVGEVTADEEDLLDFEFGEEAQETTLTGAGAGAEDDNSLDFDMSSLDFNLDEEMQGDNLESDNLEALDAMDNDDHSIDFDMGDMGTAAADESSVDMEEEPTEMLAMGSDNEVNLGSIDFESESAETQQTVATAGGGEASGLELSLDDFENEDTLHAGAGSDFDVDLDLADTSTMTGGADDMGLSEEEGLDEDIFADVDEIGTKLDLAKAYVDMGDSDGARSILDEVMEEGDDSQKEQAQQLLQQMMG